MIGSMAFPYDCRSAESLLQLPFPLKSLVCRIEAGIPRKWRVQEDVMINIREITKADRAAWADFRAALWPEESADAHLQEIDRVLASGDLWVFFAEIEGRAVGFAEVSLRRYANGCQQQPVAFLEGIYVAPERRRKGAGQKLMAHLRDFLRARGYTELCSDALLANTTSHAAHKAWGFAETERVVYFRTPL